MENFIVGKTVLKGIDKQTFQDAKNWLDQQNGCPYDIDEHVLDAANNISQETGETVVEVIESWAYSYNDLMAEKGLKELNKQ
ncbi:MAG: hypothetical protein CL596_05190 [Alteromonas sp.]|nr:hypothetical protein [Alteromonas sp.]|tara:strand:- start:13786 stop:14031 length:246 start_codon:yes stop_codon:yes gene_type:complete